MGRIEWSRDWDAAGCTGHTRNIYYDGFVTSIRPADFLRLVPDMDNKPKTDAFLSGHFVWAPPQVYVEWAEPKYDFQREPVWKVQNHEGRHRATMAMRMGEEWMPLDVVTRGFNAPRLSESMVLAPIESEKRAWDMHRRSFTFRPKAVKWSRTGDERDMATIEKGGRRSNPDNKRLLQRIQAAWTFDPPWAWGKKGRYVSFHAFDPIERGADRGEQGHGYKPDVGSDAYLASLDLRLKRVHATPILVHVVYERRRQGIASWLYREAERVLGVEVRHSGNYTADGKAFRHGRRR